MIHVTTYNAQGRIGQCMTLRDNAEADLNGHWIAGHWEGREYYIPQGRALPRPGLDIPETITLATDAIWSPGPLPEGTRVEIDGILLGVSDASALTLSFPLARTYALRLTPPFPCKPAQCRVIVHASEP